MRRALIFVAAAVALAGCSTDEAVVAQPADRLLLVSLPGVAWDDVRRGDLPTLQRFADEAAVANLATRVGRRSATLPAAYLTMNAGTRAVAPRAAAGVALEPDELYHTEPAAPVVARRLGQEHTGIAYLAIGTAREANDRSAYGAEIGVVGEALARAGVNRTAIGNADIREGRLDDGAYGRSVVALLIDGAGMVDGGAVDRSVLTGDADGAYGVGLDRGAVLDAAAAGLDEPRAAVVVEASDLERATRYRGATGARRQAMRRDALAEADELLADLLALVGPNDAVLVVSPVAPGGGPDLAVAAIRAPGTEPGLLRSATTRRDGYVQLADVGPTILSVLGLDPPDDLEGRPFRLVDDRADDPVADLARAAELAEFRDDIVPATVTVLITVLAALCALAVLGDRAPPAVRRRLPVAGAVVLGMLPASFLSARLGVRTGLAFALLLLAGGAIVGGASALTDRRWPGTMPIVSVGSVLAVIVLDVLVGAPLQLNTVFGYSVAVAGRFAGVGNLAFALLGASALVFAALVAERHGRRGRWVAIGVLGIVMLVDGLPVLGADVGGVLSIVPAFGLAALVLLGRRIRLAHVLGVAAAAVVALAVVAFVDLARPDAEQTHLARLAEHVLDRRWEPFVDSLTRRWSASFGQGETGAWVVLVLVAALVSAYLVQRALLRGRLSGPGHLGDAERAAAVGLTVLALLGLVANDSSFAVPFTMLLVVAPALLQRRALA